MRETIRKHKFHPIQLTQERLVVLLAHLNEDRQKQEPAKRVEKILELLSCLRDDLGTPEKVRVITSLRNALKRYHWTSRVDPTPEGWRVIASFDRGLSKDDVWEYEAVRDLLDTVPHLGKQPRIRRCAECRKWIFAAKREDQQFCVGGKCKQRHYDSDPKRREDKRAAMRAHYKAMKRHRLNPKSGVGLQGKLKVTNPPKKSQ